jgi:hypothetical protein
MVRTARRALVVFVGALSLVVFATQAQAQSVIQGVVKDSSGAVMPGVNVEASSPALIEGSRSAVSDASGLYRLVDLRPGVYTLTYTLQGFNTVKRELELSSNFTATIDITLAVGSLEESVTVSGASPVVDVATNVKQQVMARDVLDAVPTARTIQSIGQLVVGVTLTTPDVGGSRAMQQAYFNVRGTGASQTVVMVDGLMTNGMMADGGVQAYHNEAMVNEAVYQTAGGSAETLTSGLNMNLIPKDGGNQFHGGAKITKSPTSWQGDNLTQDLRALGVGAVDRISNFYEWNVEQGGPILKDKLWFYAAFRKARYDKPIANTFVTPAGVPFNQGFVQCRDNPGSCEQGVSDEKMDNPIARLTWQMSQGSKLAVYMDRAMRFRGHAMGAGDDPQTASVQWNTPTFATGSIKYTSTLTSNVLFEAGFSGNRERYDNLYQPGLLGERNTAEWYRNVRRQDTSLGTEWGAPSAQLGNYPDRYYLMSAVSWVKGAHNLKFGVYDSFGKYPRYNNANADLYQDYQNSVGFRVQVLNTPLHVQENLDANLGLYAQDSWRMNKLTLNYGLRFDYVKQRIVGQEAQIGRFASSAAYDDIVLPTWASWSPRLSAVYDVFGNGKTAVRGGFNKFMVSMTTGLAQLYSPTALTTAQLPWTDLNGDDIAQGERGCTFRSAGCEIDFTNLSPNFGVRSLSELDPETERPYQYAYNVGISHEVLPGFSAAFEWYHNNFKALTERNNVLRTFDSYRPVDVRTPDGQTVRVYDVRPEFANQTRNVDSTDHDLRRSYNGFDLSFNARLRGGVRLFGGFNVERTLTDSCSAGTDPNFQLGCNQYEAEIPWQKQFKITGVYPLPWFGINLSAAWQSLNGYAIGTQALQFAVFNWGSGYDRPNGLATHYLVTRTTTNPDGTLAIPNMQSTSIQVPMDQPGTLFTPRMNQVDISGSKSITFGWLTMQPKIDVFNVLNSDDYTAVETAQFNASAYLRPSSVLQGRIIRVGVDMRW